MATTTDKKETICVINESNINIDIYRKLIHSLLDRNLIGSALFWADKVVALSSGDPRDIYWQAQCMFLQKQYHRAAQLIQSRGLEKTYVQCNYLVVRCLFEANDYQEAMKVMDSLVINLFPEENSLMDVTNLKNAFFDDTPKNQVQAAILLMKGKLYEAMENRGLATECFKHALQFDVYCYEAFDALVRHQMLSAAEEKDLLNSIPVREQCPSESDALLLKILYENKLKQYHSVTQTPIKDVVVSNLNEIQSDAIITLPSFTSLPLHAIGKKKSKNPNPAQATAVVKVPIQLPQCAPHLAPFKPPNNPVMFKTPFKVTSQTSVPARTTSPQNTPPTVSISNNSQTVATVNSVVKISVVLLDKIQASLDFIVSQAEKLFYNSDYQRCRRFTEYVLKKDPYNIDCLTIHISCLVELKESNSLFILAHKLVDLYPNLAIAWFAVGCYYYVIGKSDPARRYLGKATILDPLFGPAWLTYGHSFAVENEHDQAMAAYFKASQLMKGCHLPLLYIGLECGLTNNVRLAEKFFSQARGVAPEDPFVIHEMGVIAFHNNNYEEAEKQFKKALSRIRRNEVYGVRWEPLLNNIGHVCRKLKKFEESLQYHHQALLLCPQKASTFAAIGFTKAMMGQAEEAVDWFHRALGLRRDDTFSSTMLNYVIEQYADDASAYPGAPMYIPCFKSRLNRKKSDSVEVFDVSSVPSNINIKCENIQQDLINLTNSTNVSMDLEMDMVDIN